MSHCCFNLYFSNSWWCWISFHMSVNLYMSSLEYVCSSLSTIFWWAFFYCINSCMNCLHINILDINPLLVLSFANIFSHSVGCLFILLMVSIDVQKLLSLIRSNLFIFAFNFFFFCLRRQIQNNIVIIYVRVFCLFSSGSFTVWGLTFRSLIQF